MRKPQHYRGTFHRENAGTNYLRDKVLRRGMDDRVGELLSDLQTDELVHVIRDNLLPRSYAESSSLSIQNQPGMSPTVLSFFLLSGNGWHSFQLRQSH